jgi:hypothetical protein
MTTTPTSSAPQRIAGRFFGLNLADLFKDDDSEGTSGFEGFQPAFKVEQISKGRGGALSYKAPRQPTQKLSMELMPAVSQTVSQTTSAAPKSLAKMSAQDIFSNYSKYDQGEQGLFGGQDVDYLRGQGVGDDTIREVARMSSATQQTPAAVYARLGGTLTSPEPAAPTAQTNPQEYATNFYGSSRDVGQQGLFGGQDVDAMRNKGYSDEQIRATASAMRRQGQELPPAVFRRLGEF